MEQRQVLKDASRQMDSVLNGGQSEANAYKHGMRERGQSIEEASQLADNFIEGREATAQLEQANFNENGGEGLSNTALGTFGDALHTITDETSPAHAGFQVWKGLGHIFSANKHRKRERRITPEQLQVAVADAQVAFLATFGNEAYQQAIRSQQGSGGNNVNQIGTEDDPNIQNIRRSFSLPGSSVIAEEETVYEYRVSAAFRR